MLRGPRSVAGGSGWLAVGVFCVLLALTGVTRAHDTWLAPAPDVGGGLVELRMQYGAHYPVADGGQVAASVVRTGCWEGNGAERALLPRRELPEFLELRARADLRTGVACWAEQRPFEVELSAEQAVQYLNEVRAPQAAVQAWARQQSRGLPWRESYRKSMRVELHPREAAPDAAALATLRRPRGLALEIVPTGTTAVLAGQSASFRVLLEGQPQANLWVQFVSQRPGPTFWQMSDAEGGVRETLPTPGQWMARATLLEIPASETQGWRSRFTTLVLDVR